MPKAKGRVGLKITHDTDAMAITVQVYDYEAEKALRSELFKMADVAAELHPKVTLYGLAKVLSDRNSQVKEDPNAKLDGMLAVLERFSEGKWEAEREGGGLGVVSAEVEAVAQLKGITIPQAQAALKEYDKPQREKILASKAVQDKASEIRRERSEGKVEKLDDLLTQ